MSATGNGITIKSSKYEYQAELESMMYTFGEMRHPNIETVQIVESIIRSQMIETLIQASQLARKRGNRFFSHDDLLFLIRRDRLKVAHLTAYLSWRKVRKIASRTGNTAQEEDEMVLDEGEERKVKRQKVKLPWSLANSFTDYLGDASDSDTDDEEREFFNESRERLKHADIATQSMTQEEYMEYAECRQASFTYKKPSKFREWLSIEHYTGMRLNNDLLDILGFICYEMVRSLTEQCLAIKKANEGKRQPTDAAQSSENNSVLQSVGGSNLLSVFTLLPSDWCESARV